MGLFENYNKSTKSTDNRPKCIQQNCIETITIGATAEHTFRFQFSFSKLIDMATVYYKQGTEVLCYVNVDSSMIYEKDNCTYVTVILNNTATRLFKYSILDTYCQFKFIKQNGELEYSEKYQLKVLAPIDYVENKIEERDVKTLLYGIFNGSWRDFMNTPGEVLLENAKQYKGEIIKPIASMQVLYLLSNYDKEQIITGGELTSFNGSVQNFTEEEIISKDSKKWKGNRHTEVVHGNLVYTVHGIFSPAWNELDQLIIYVKEN